MPGASRSAAKARRVGSDRKATAKALLEYEVASVQLMPPYPKLSR